MSSFNIIGETNEATVVVKYTPEERKSTDYQSETELEKDFDNNIIPDLVDFTKTFFAKHTILNMAILTSFIIK